MALQSSKYRMPQNGPAQDDATPPTVAPLQLHGISGYKQPQTLAMRVQAYGGPESLLCMLHVALRSAVCNLQSAVCCSPRSARRNFVRPWLRALHLGRCPRSSSETNYPLLFLAPHPCTTTDQTLVLSASASSLGLVPICRNRRPVASKA